VLFVMAEYLTLGCVADSAAERAIEHQRKLNELNNKKLWGK